MPQRTGATETIKRLRADNKRLRQNYQTMYAMYMDVVNNMQAQIDRMQAQSDYIGRWIHNCTCQRRHDV